ncbi:MAG: hypothetical protein Q9227_006771 [Pyrenula ochraceoflavens]
MDPGETSNAPRELPPIPSRSLSPPQPANPTLLGGDEEREFVLSSIITDEFQRSRPTSPLTKQIWAMSHSVRGVASQHPYFDFRALSYLPDYDQRLMCPICHVPFIEPRRLVCDHMFCISCFNEHLKSTQDPNGDSCPSCRARTGRTLLSVPRIITNMCDDVKVYCLYRHQGCEEIMARESAPYHASICEFQLLRCPDSNCRGLTRKGDIKPDVCRHFKVKCNGCDEMVMDQDSSRHFEKCPSCSECGASRELKGEILHQTSCSNGPQHCAGSSYGCDFKSTGDRLRDHEEKCVFAKLSPHLTSSAQAIRTLRSELTQQKSRSEELSNANKQLWDILTNQIGPAIDSVKARTEGPSSSRARSSSPTEADLLPPHSSPPRRTTFSGVPSLSPTHQTRPLPQSPSQPTPPAPAPDPFNHLLSLHESLRSDVHSMTPRIDQLTTSLQDLMSSFSDSESRTNMMLLNDMLRIKEDLAHTNAALFSTRAQVNWLTRLNGLNPNVRQPQPGIGSSSSQSHGGGGQQEGAAAGSGVEQMQGASSGASTSTAAAQVRGRPGPEEGRRRPSDGTSSQERVKL